MLSLGGYCKHLKYHRVLPVCFYHVTFLKDFWGGFSTTYLHDIDVVFIKCASKCFFVSRNNVILRKGYIVTTNETFIKKGLINFQKFLLLFIPFFVTLFKCFFKDFLRSDTHVSLFLIYQYIFPGRILIHFVSCVDIFSCVDIIYCRL